MSNNSAGFIPAPPKEPMNPRLLPITEALSDDDSFTDCRMEHGVLKGSALRVALTRAVLRDMKFETAFPSLELEDVLFEGCDLSNAVFSDAILVRAAFRNCRMTGADFSGASLKDVLFENCVLKYANFSYAKFNRAAFCECSATEAEFGETALLKTRFLRTDLRSAQLSGTPLKGIDLTSCRIDGMGARPDDLRGAILSPEQAITAAKILGVEIRF